MLEFDGVGKLSKKLFPADELREKVTIRVLPEKLQVYPRFKELVTKRLGSDVCFVTTSLWEAFCDLLLFCLVAPVFNKFFSQLSGISIQFVYHIHSSFYFRSLIFLQSSVPI